MEWEYILFRVKHVREAKMGEIIRAHRWFFILVGSGLMGVFFYLVKVAIVK